MSKQIGGGQHNPNRGPLDFYPTDPAWVTVLLNKVDFTGGKVDEPCAGDGAISRILLERGFDVISSDIEPQADGIERRNAFDINYHKNVITNPPYGTAYDLINHWLRNTEGKVAVLMRLGFLEAQRRLPLFRNCPPAQILLVCNRMTVNGAKSQFPHCWVVWDNEYPATETIFSWETI